LWYYKKAKIPFNVHNICYNVKAKIREGCPIDGKYLCIDLKSFYASVECAERGLDPMTTNLVVADPERSDKTICLAITPAMKKLGIKNRCRIFEIPKGVEYIIAAPRMKRYIDYSADIYEIYLGFFSKDDIFVYSIDEVFINIAPYMKKYKLSPKQLAVKVMDEVFKKTGIRAACGIGTNLYLAKIALDITAKHSSDFIGWLDEQKFCDELWDHTPITDFWRIGRGTADRLATKGIYTMGQVARADENMLYKLFGIDAELLIDHAFGREPVTIADIKKYKPKTGCLTSGQVLMRDYEFYEGKLIVREMTDLLCLEMVERNVLTGSITLTVGYSNALKAPAAHGTKKLPFETSADSVIVPAAAELYERIVDKQKPVRRITVVFNNLIADDGFYQTDLFCEVSDKLLRNNKVQRAVVNIKKRFGKNSILKGMNYESGGTTVERNSQIGGHKSGE